jgi:predicted PurR-regulated permease PerM
MAPIDPKLLRQIFFLGILFILGGILFKELSFLVSPTIGAFTLAILLKRPMHYLTKTKKRSKPFAATMLMLGTFIMLIGSIASSIALVSPHIQISLEANHLQSILQNIDGLLQKYTGMEILTPDLISSFSSNAQSIVQNILSSTFDMLIGISFMYLFLYFLLFYVDSIEHALASVMPFSNKNQKIFIKRLYQLVVGNALSIPLVIFTQGIFAAFGYWIFGVDAALTLGLLTGLASVIPVIGTMFVWIPIGLYFIGFGSVWTGVWILAYGLIVVGSVDNFARSLFQYQLSHIHPLTSILGVMVGTSLFGLVGVIFGPILISIFILLVKIYREEMGIVK